MKIETTTSSQHAALVLRGDFETDAAASFLDEVAGLIAGGSPRMTVSFRYVKYINSTALGSIVRARTNCRDSGGDLVIVRPSKLTRDIITKMGLDSVLPLFDDENEAASYLAGQGKAPAAAASSKSDGDEQTASVMFAFDDARSELVPGKSHHGVGVLASVDADGLVFRWDPSHFGSDAANAAAMFLKGSTMRNKMQIKMIRKDFFEGLSTIEDLTLNPAGDVTVKARWSRISDADRDALRRYKDDLDFLQKQADESSR